MTAPERFRARQLAKRVDGARCVDCGGPCRWLRCVRCRARRTAGVAQKRHYHATHKVQVAATQRLWHERNKAHVHALQRARRARVRAERQRSRATA